MSWRSLLVAAAALIPLTAEAGPAQDVESLRLVPFPKEVRLEDGGFSLDRPLVLEASADQRKPLGRMLTEELKRAGYAPPEVRDTRSRNFFRLSTGGGQLPRITFPLGKGAEEYTLNVRPNEVVCDAVGLEGLSHGMQTLCQLLRANRRDGAIRCLTIHDWPSLRWRCFQDDMTRGPSSTLDTLQFEVALGAHLKLNLFTYYMEYQYAFEKHPVIGPENGSLEPADLEALVEYAKRHHVEVLGNQQSFGHFARILEHDEYAELRETPSLLCPVREQTYDLLDDLYSEVCPLLPFEMFNVCCDETRGLGTGPSKERADEIGVGGLYVEHVRRVHGILKEKHRKRMMMWGDIILQHPDHLQRIPKDTVMLTWGYGNRESFESQIIPFADSGYEFFVCPGISNWSRILPDFAVATENIRNFVRDGAKHGALGVLNTAWEDDGEALQGYKWHGYAWGAECAWNASTTTPEAFNRRIGAVLFGEKGDHFGQAVDLLGQTHQMSGMQGMNNRRFWQDDFKPTRAPEAIRKSAEGLLSVVRPAIEHLEACKAEASVNGDLLDYFHFGARRMELIGQRMLDGLEVARLYTQAYDAPADLARPLLTKAEAMVKKNGAMHQSLRDQFALLWRAESKPYALDWTLDRYAAAVKRYDELAARLAEALETAEAGKPLPRPEELGLLVPESFARRARPREEVDVPLDPDAPWADPSATHRLGVVVRAGAVDRFELPVAVAVPLPEDLASKPIRAFCRLAGGEPREVLAQLDPSDKPGRTRLTLLIPDRIAKGAEARVHVYLGLPESPQPLPESVSTKDGPDGKKWIENDKVRLLLAPEGGHVYRWEVKALAGRDVTMPGETGWFGFADVHTLRSVPHKLRCVARGPALVRYECSTAEGLVKSIGLFGGVSWMEVLLSEPTGHYWDFDSPSNFAADGPNPGSYLFSNGETGPVSPEGPHDQTQVRAANVHWGVKLNDLRLALGLCTPEVAAGHVVGPGGGSGGVGIERSTPASHFVTYAGLLEAEPGETMGRLRQTLDLRNQPEVVLYATQPRD
ncbi:MAG: glycoside hydrolase family 20 zincin-like fold domain-containing protein [Planctomycetota bacterium]|jgi:hypothetical protein